MGLGSTAKKLQKVSSLAEDSYKKMNELREQLTQLREEVQTTSEQVDTLERDVAEQRAILEAIAEQQGLDVERIVADANIDDADATETEASADAAESTDTSDSEETAEGAADPQAQ